MAEFQKSEYDLWPKGHFFDDFSEGQKFKHHWGRTLTESDAINFATTTLRYLPLYFNRDYAQKQGHRDLVVDPMFVLATVIGLSVEDLSEAGGPFLGVNKVRFGVSVYPGDTIYASSIVKAKRTSSSRPNTGIVTWETTGTNERDEVVIEYERTNLVAMRRRRTS